MPLDPQPLPPEFGNEVLEMSSAPTCVVCACSRGTFDHSVCRAIATASGYFGPLWTGA